MANPYRNQADEITSSPWRLASVAALYIALGAMLGFIQGGIGPILRTRGVALASMGWVFALYIPFGVTFLWAPLVDRCTLPWLGRRTGWIITAQAIAAAVLAAIALGERLSMPALFVLSLSAALAMATMDLALDAWTVEQVAARLRPVAAASKVGGLSLGAVLGGGVLVALFPKLGWMSTLFLLASVQVVAMLPAWMLAAHETGKPTGQPAVEQARAGLRLALKQPLMRDRLLRVSLVTCALMALFNLNRLMLIDGGVSLQHIGWILGIASPLANLASSTGVSWLMRRSTPGRVLWGMVGLALLSAALIVVALTVRSPGTAIAGSILAGACVSGIYVVIAASILGWAAGSQAATDYALLYGVGRFIGTLLLLAIPGLVSFIGWRAFYIATAFGVLCAAGCIAKALKGYE